MKIGNRIKLTQQHKHNVSMWEYTSVFHIDEFVRYKFVILLMTRHMIPDVQNRIEDDLESQLRFNLFYSIISRL